MGIPINLFYSVSAYHLLAQMGRALPLAHRETEKEDSEKGKGGGKPF
jgi:hypothetical protein